MPPPDPSWVNPVTTRSRVVLEIASELVAAPDTRLRQAKVLLREQGSGGWALGLFGSSTNEGIDEVVRGESALAIVNPAAPLTLAHRGTGPWQHPQPVRTIAVIPSLDRCVLAVRRDIGVAAFEDIAARRLPLRLSLRGQRDHCLHMVLDHLAAAAGFSLDDLKGWGGEICYDGGPPFPAGPRFQALARGEVDAVFDEAADIWLDEAVAAGAAILPFGDATVAALEAIGYRRASLDKARHPGLSRDVLTIDFSGWPIFVHAELPDPLVTRMCEALDARKHLIPWEGDGPLPVERMCRDGADTPLDVPLHRAAARCWRARGYLP